MKHICLYLFLLFTNNLFAQGEKNITNSEIEDVKVFLSGAQIHRSFNTTIENGITQIALQNLSSQVDRNSISVSGKGDATILSVSYSLDYLQDKRTTPKLKSLEDSLESLTDQTNELNMLKSVYNEEIGMLNSNKSVGGSNVGVNADNLQKVIAFYRQRMIEVKTKILEADKKIVKIAEIIKNINEQIGEENGKLDQPYGTILIYVSAKQRASVDFDVTYYAAGASWTPSYDLRALDVKSPVNITYKAMVSQSTGENWSNVRVVLSTGNPTLGGTKPELRPWFLRYQQPVYREQQMQLNEVVIQGAAKKEKSLRSDFNQMQSPAVEMNENQLATEFEILIPYSVSTSGQPVTMDIQTFNLPADYNYSTVPKADKDAFLLANITGWEKLNLLPGVANIYFENTYVGKSNINPSSTNDTLSLSFGRDKRIVIKRESLKNFSSVKYFGSNVEKEFVFETSIRNTKSENIILIVHDQIPLSTDESIKITTEELSSGNYNKETGMVSWKLDLKAGETKKVKVGYKVKYDKDKVISGL